MDCPLRRYVSFVLLFSLLAGSSDLSAQDPAPVPSVPEAEPSDTPLPSAESVEERIRRVKAQIESSEKQLREIRRKAGELENQIGVLDEQGKRVTNKQTAVRAQLAKFDEEQQRLEAELTRSSRKLEDLETRFRQRLISNYKILNQATGVSYLVTAKSATDFLRRGYYLSRISSHDEQGVSEMQEVLRVVNQSRRDLAELTTKKKTQLSALEAIERDLQKSEDEKRALLLKKQNEARTQEVSLKKLTRMQKDLEALLESLTGGEEIPTPPEVPVGEATPVPSEEPVPPPPQLINRPAPFRGAGLDGLRGSLVFPVSGRLISGFGKQRHEEFSEVLFHKGIEMEAAGSSPVQAIASGKVVVQQDLPGIGLTVIVDHGDRYYSLYGRLQSVVKRAGEEVQRGEAIGKIGSPDQQGRNFYFELRLRGKAVDPAPFFKNLPVNGNEG